MDEGWMTKMVASETKAQTIPDSHARKAELRQLYTVFDDIMNRDVSKSTKESRPTVPTTEVYQSGEKNREPPIVTKVCGRLNAYTKQQQSGGGGN